MCHLLICVGQIPDFALNKMPQPGRDNTGQFLSLVANAAYGVGSVMSALGQKQTSEYSRAMSALPPIADIADSGLDVR